VALEYCLSLRVVSRRDDMNIDIDENDCIVVETKGVRLAAECGVDRVPGPRRKRAKLGGGKQGGGRG
jgi:hypothetical protein